jgi:hypothetical protein
MRPLTVIPRHPITELALSPDGQRLGVVQSVHGFRLLDALTGAELARDTERGNVSEVSPTGRHWLHAERMAIRLAEVTAGRPFLRFQTGWTRAGNINRPPVVPETSPLHSAATVSWDAPAARRLLISPPPVERVYLTAGALTADHRFAVGRLGHGDQRYAVRDLATERIIATLDITTSPPGSTHVHTLFTPDEAGIVAATLRTILMFSLPAPEPLVSSPLDAVGSPITRVTPLAPTVVIRVTQPQPAPGIPPFAVLPCGRKALVRGEKSRVELRDLATGEVLTVWKWGLQRLHALAVAADGLTAAAGGFRGEVVIWDLG